MDKLEDIENGFQPEHCLEAVRNEQHIHRHIVRDDIYDNGGWIEEETEKYIKARFESFVDRDHVHRGMHFRGYKCYRRLGKRLTICVPYVFGRACCDRGAYYVEIDEEKELQKSKNRVSREDRNRKISNTIKKRWKKIKGEA